MSETDAARCAARPAGRTTPRCTLPEGHEGEHSFHGDGWFPVEPDKPVTEQIGVEPPPGDETKMPTDADVLDTMREIGGAMGDVMAGKPIEEIVADFNDQQKRTMGGVGTDPPQATTGYFAPRLPGQAQVEDPDDTFQLRRPVTTISEVPFIDATQYQRARNGRELAHWLLGKLEGKGDALSVRVRLRSEYLGGVAAVLLDAGFTVAPYDVPNAAAEQTIEVSTVARSVTLYEAFKAWRQSEDG